MNQDGVKEPATQARALAEEKWTKSLGDASSYMKAAREGNSPRPPEIPGSILPIPLASSPSSSSRTLEHSQGPLVLPSTVKIAEAMVKTESTLQYYKNLQDVDEHVKSMYPVVDKLDGTLYFLKRGLEYNSIEDVPYFGHMLLDLLEAKDSLENIIRQILKEDDSLRARRKSRPVSIGYNGEHRSSWTGSFSQQSTWKLMASVEDIRSLIIPIMEAVHTDLDGSGVTQPPTNGARGTEVAMTWAVTEARWPDKFGPSQLCYDCMRIFRARELWPINPRKNDFQPRVLCRSSVKKLFDMAQNGCRFCRMQYIHLLSVKSSGIKSSFDIWKIASARVEWWKFWTEEHLHSESSAHDNRTMSLVNKDFGIHYYGQKGIRSPLNIYVTKRITQEDADRRIAAHTGSRESLSIAKQWIRNCLNHHKLCNSLPRQGMHRPSRLIFLGVDKTVTPRVMESHEIPSNVKYMTLSHCYGEKPVLQLTKRTHATFTRGIERALIPKTWLEAMEVTQQLGVFYLWIDNLCIIHDSESDLQKESSLTPDVYRGSWCNIAATGGLDSESGLYAERNPKDIRGCIIKDHTTGENFKVELDSEGSRLWERHVSNSRLMNRGWVLQEVTLAPRTLHYGIDRVFWQCKTQTASEDSPSDSRTNTMRYYKNSLPGDTDSDKEFFGPPGWAAVVHRYTRCQLTLPAQDKLVAIAGIAKGYGSENDYLAGLWRDDLLLQLPWRPDVSPEWPEEYQAPSWSWASLNQEVKYPWKDTKMTRFDYIAEFIDADIELVSYDKFGQVSHGRIRLQGPLVELEFRGALANEATTVSWGTNRHEFPDFHSNFSFEVFPDEKRYYQILPVDLDHDDHWLEAGDTLYCMPLFYQRDPNPLSVQGAIHGLVLEPTGERRGEFQRRGTIFLGDNMKGGGHVISAFETLCRQSETEIPREFYESRDEPRKGLPMYTISIV